MGLVFVINGQVEEPVARSTEKLNAVVICERWPLIEITYVPRVVRGSVRALAFVASCSHVVLDR